MQRIHDYKEMDIPLSEQDITEQAARCMDCGIPFCHGMGCPVVNRIPEFNDLVYQGKWEQACHNLHSTNNFPEVTGRICPAPCETACTLNIDENPVLICHIEYQIAERGFAQGWIKPMFAEKKTGKTVAVIGSGPAGMAAAQQLARAGHTTTLFERDDRIGGLLRYGIPDFKLDKKILDRRMKQMMLEGVNFKTNVNVGVDISADQLLDDFDAICVTIGSTIPRDLPVPGRSLAGVHFAMDYLKQQNKLNAGDTIPSDQMINARNKTTIVIGGGDTGSDCVGTAIRQGAQKVYQFEILPKPPLARKNDNPWPFWPLTLRTSTSQQEGCQRRWSILTKELKGQDGILTELCGVKVEWKKTGTGFSMNEKEGSEFSVKTDLILLAMGFTNPQRTGLLDEFDLELDNRGNVKINENCQTSNKKVFAAGDANMGASLVVRAIYSGRQAAAGINQYLT
ncbi:MAG: glutamate synthase subunit beta [Phycisphaerae bacterium]|nr:glutamate synthase subunit beta [Phycisphaerae bacterium]